MIWIHNYTHVNQFIKQVPNLANSGLWLSESLEEAVMSESGILSVSIPRLSMHTGPAKGVKPVECKNKGVHYFK